ncbi:ATP-binding cassette domain-containing protein [Algicola sagamiensis]|uniref:ATP-binding cassette domain-containing protein n=1 Tax=Algicola sagamiensis TaxID=163869 RepID=UPI000364D3A8|nr:ATP-binding cassette domain-containing protein [Algicola sagamiensis]
MPILQAVRVGYQFANGDQLLNGVSCTLTNPRVGLVGRNGAGKSIFASILAGSCLPTEGVVTANTSIAMYTQSSLGLRHQKRTIAQYLNVDHIIYALEQIESGSCDPKWFDVVGEQWEIQEKLNQKLSLHHLPQDLCLPCSSLSGGELAKLQLWHLFEQNAGLLILDEPSNHLDAQGKQWLNHQISQYQGYILLISHDRQLLRSMEQIWELSHLRLKQYGGNYDFYLEKISQESAAIERQFSCVQRQQKQLEMRAQKNKEKFEQRAALGNKTRKKGGQSKLLLNAMLDQATSSISNRLKNEAIQRKQLKQKLEQLEMQRERVKPQKIYIPNGDPTSRNLVNIVNGMLSYGSNQPINLQINSETKLHLHGKNGSGKSTLLKAICGEKGLMNGTLQVNTSVCYLDQHFGRLDHKLTVLEQVLADSYRILESDARTLLAGIGFRRESVHLPVGTLSGGEKMKLAMLIVSHHPAQPLLLLDEPDNHLDIHSKNLLADVLNQYRGAFVLVSHDDEFVHQTGVNCRYRAC